MFRPKNILVPTDFSKYSDMALKQAVDLAEEFHARIYLLHVIDEGIQQCVADYCLSEEVMIQLDRDSLKTSKEKLEKEVKKIAKAKKVAMSFDIKKGAPAEVILQEQKTKKINLIVIASHGRTGLLKNLMGSIADKVSKGATCPVMIVK